MYEDLRGLTRVLNQKRTKNNNKTVRKLHLESSPGGVKKESSEDFVGLLVSQLLWEIRRETDFTRRALRGPGELRNPSEIAGKNSPRFRKRGESVRGDWSA